MMIGMAKKVHEEAAHKGLHTICVYFCLIHSAEDDGRERRDRQNEPTSAAASVTGETASKIWIVWIVFQQRDTRKRPR